MTLEEKSQFIKSKAKEHGFSAIGIVKVASLDKEGERLKAWLSQGHHGQMTYLENHYGMRIDPKELVEDACSIISLTYNYYPQEEIKDNSLKIAKYAYGKDYHKVIRKKLKLLLKELKEQLPGIDGRACVDSAPVMEREWAQRAGVGWYGKNGLIINPKEGSFFFLAELIVNVDLAYDSPISDHCGTCTRCIDACPTNAISEEGYQLDASKCISYLTIELKEEQIPQELEGDMEGWIFGCDICQDVCPWNKFSSPHNEAKFVPSEALQGMTKEEWKDLTEEKFDQLFIGSAVKRTGYNGLMRNIKTTIKSDD